MWLIIGVGAVLIVTGIGVYFYVDKLTVTQCLSMIPIKNFVVFQIKMLGNFSKTLDIVFSSMGVASIIFALDRLALRKAAYRMACFIDIECVEKK